MAYPYDGMFYPTLPQDTQDFPAVLSGVGRSLREIGRSTQYLPYDVLGAPVDLATLVARPFGYQTQTPVGGSDWLIDLARQYGIADKPTGSGTETLTRLAVGIPSPVAVPRAIGAFAQGLERASDITTEQANRAADALVRQITGNPQATAPQVLQETAMPFMQAVAPRPSGLLETPVKSDLGFYSALEQATIPLQNKGTGSQFLAQIEKTAGVKPEEVKWTGLDEFLKSRQNVTKQEVQDYLAANRVNLQEVQLGGPLRQNTMFPGGEVYGPNNTFVGKLNLDENGNFQFFLQDGKVINTNISDERFAIRAIEREVGPIMSERAYDTQVRTKFSSYTLPGGENYREILLTLPQKSVSTAMPDTSKWSVVTKETSPTSGARQVQVRDEQGNMVGQRFSFQGTDEDAIQEVLPGFLERQSQIANQKTNFLSTHFPQPNILAHMRVNDRVVDGKKTLFIEEIQSDWHQAGRKKGYQSSIEQRKATNAIRQDGYWEVRDQNGEFVTNVMDYRLPDANAEKAIEVANARIAANRPTEIHQSGMVPDAPFKTTWHELSLKRAIQEASEKGYDQIAFTTGKTQVERYPEALRQIADEIVWDTYGGGTRHVMVKKNGATIFGAEVDKNGIIERANQDELIGKNLEEVIGKPMAQRTISEEAGEIKGKDFTVGGKGMEGFYDQILPKTLDKLGKKFDAKVGKTNMDGTEVWKMDITPKMRESVLTKGQPLFAATPAIPALGLLGSEEE